MKRYLPIIASCVVAVGLVGVAIGFSSGAIGDSSSFTPHELARFNGKNGQKCYVAVDGVVYEIEQGRQWKDGQHRPSKGQAECGKDLSQVISKSPHGRAKLKTLPVVGKLEQ